MTHPLRGKTYFARRGVPRRYSHQAFGRAILEKPEDQMPSLVYADWLEENGMPTYAGIVRHHIARQGEGGWGPHVIDAARTEIDDDAMRDRRPIASSEWISPIHGNLVYVTHFPPTPRGAPFLGYYFSQSVADPAEARRMLANLQAEGIRVHPRAYQGDSRPRPRRRRFARNEDYNRLFVDAARDHPNVPPDQFEEFARLDHWGVLRRAARGNEDVAHDAMTRMLYGTQNQRQGVLLSGHDPARMTLTKRFLGMARSTSRDAGLAGQGMRKTDKGWVRDAVPLSGITDREGRPVDSPGRPVTSEALKPVVRREPPGGVGGRGKRAPLDQTRMMMDMLKKGKSLAQIGKKFGITKQGVARRLTDARRLLSRPESPVLPAALRLRLSRSERRHRRLRYAAGDPDQPYAAHVVTYRHRDTGRLTDHFVFTADGPWEAIEQLRRGGHEPVGIRPATTAEFHANYPHTTPGASSPVPPPRARPVGPKTQVDYTPGAEPPLPVARPVKPPVAKPVARFIPREQAPPPVARPVPNQELKQHSVLSLDADGRPHLHTLAARDATHAAEVFGQKVRGHQILGITEGPPGPGATRTVGKPKRLARPVRYSHQAFAAQMVSEPENKLNALVYADWLEEQGNPGHAEVVRHWVRRYGAPYFVTMAAAGNGYGLDRGDQPFVDMYTTFPKGDEKQYVVRVLRQLPDRDHGLIGHVAVVGPEDAHRIVSTMPGVLNADRSRAELEAAHPWLRRRLARRGAPRRLSRADHIAHIRAIAADLDDHMPRLTYADRLEEHGLSAVPDALRRSAQPTPLDTPGPVPGHPSESWVSGGATQRYATPDGYSFLVQLTPHIKGGRPVVGIGSQVYVSEFEKPPVPVGYYTLIPDYHTADPDLVRRLLGEGQPYEDYHGTTTAASYADRRRQLLDHVAWMEGGPRPQRLARRGAPRRYSREDETAFHRAIHDRPHDQMPALAYSDWLEENGKPHHAEAIRRGTQFWLRRTNGHRATDTGETRWDRPPGTVFVSADPYNQFGVSRDDFGNRLANIWVWINPLSHPGSRLHYRLDAPREDAERILAGLHAEGAEIKTNAVWNPPQDQSGEPERLSAYRAPAGGMIVRGQYFQGGMMVPDLQTFGSPGNAARGRIRAALAAARRKKGNKPLATAKAFALD